MNWAELQSDKALVCQKEHRCDSGVGIVWFVLLSDGYLIDCGSERQSEARANILAIIINEAGADRLSHKALGQPAPKVTA